LYPEQFYTFNTIFPPVSEQQRIADYLDEKCGEIDSLIALQEQMIEKLKAYKQSVITEAVTKGLNPNAKLVPSGIDWIGEIPEGWLVTDIKKLCISITDGSHFSPERQSEGMPYITAGDIRGKGIDYNKAMRIRIEDYNLLESQGCRPHKGDILMVKDGATTGRVGMMIDNEECVLLSSVAMLTPLPNVDSNYLMYLIQSNVIQAQIQLLMAGSAMPRVTLKKINSLEGLLIPLNDQHSIASYLDEKCADIDRLIALKQQKIESLKDYKKSVIYEAVTGKTIIE
jgi:type I restriction enzyme S subunit